ncbi:MAG: VCBS repeat-containing protein [Spirochaetales bacterium]|nr:VCBS repeat-containing protein [Spirochaetales bacterium]
MHKLIRHIKLSSFISLNDQHNPTTYRKQSWFHLLPASLLLLTLALLSLPGTGFYATQKTIYISPFKVHAQQDISFLEDAMRSMMASRLAANAGLKIVEDKAAADYTLHGDITAIGTSLSINSKINTRDGSVPEATFYASAASENDIIPAVDTLAANISQQYFNSKGHGVPAAPVAATSQAQITTQHQQANTGFQTAHPDRAFLSPGQAGSGLVKPQSITTAQGFQKTRNLPISMQDMAGGDIDGDGTNDLVVASTNEIFAYQMTGSSIAPFGQITLSASQKIISMELADLDDDGVSEIYITSVNRSQRPNGMAVRWENNGFTYLFQNQRWFIKPISTPGQGKILAGQRGGIEYPMSEGIYELALQDGQLTDINKLPVPPQANIYNFAMADLDGDGMTEVIMLDENDKLHVMMAGGKQLWVGDDYYGGSLRYIGGNSATRRKGGAIKQPVNEENDGDQDRLYIHSRILIADVNNDNQPDVVVNKNLSSASRVFKNFKAYPSGEVHALSWTGIGLTELWRTQKIDGYVASYDFIKEPGSTKAELYVGLIINSGWMDMLSAQDSTVLIYPFEIPTPE